MRLAAAGCAALLLALAGCSDDDDASPAPTPRDDTVGVCPGSSVAAGPARLQRSGRWLTDPQGRVVLLHGVNTVWKRTPFVPPEEPAGFIAADAAWLREHGFNSARIGTLWEGISPQAAGQVDENYLDAWDRVVQLMAAQKIWMLFDFHQDMMGPIYQGEGLPQWAIDAVQGPFTTLLGSPAFGFPFNYFTPQVSEAFDNLWAEKGVVWDGHRDAWIAVASKWKEQPYSMGYDLLNEPWSGLEYPTCIMPPMVGCPSTDQNELQPFFEHAIAGVRSVDTHNMVWIEPQLLAGGTGSPTGFQPFAGESQLGYSVHNYCPLTALTQAAQLGIPVPLPVGPQDTCENFETSNFEQSRITSERIGAVELITEFGASDDPVLLARVTRLADEHLVGWQYWHYKEWADPTTQSQDSGGQGMFADDADLGSVKVEKLKLLERTYPQATAGDPLELSFDPATAAFLYRYTPRCTAGPTEIHVPAIHYPDGYELKLTGARQLSAVGASPLLLENLPGATEVKVEIARK